MTRILSALIVICAASLEATVSLAQDWKFASDFPESVNRIWPGPDYFANRHLDWRIDNGRLECREGSSTKPMRTVHLLTHWAKAGDGVLEMSVRTESIEPGEGHENTWSGFLIGVGGDHVDYRTSALSHHWPGNDGGLIVAFDGLGRVVFRDNAHDDGPRRPAGNIRVRAWPLLASGTARPGLAYPESGVILKLRAEPNANGYRVTLTVLHGESGVQIAETFFDNFAPEQIDGNVALVSHTSPKKEGPGYWFDDWRVGGSKIQSDGDRSFGPIVAAQYTLSEGTLKLTAQLTPLGDSFQDGVLKVLRDDNWQTVAHSQVNPEGFTLPFRVEEWTEDHDLPYRVEVTLREGGTRETSTFDGVIRRPPVDKDEVVVAAFTGHHISAQGQGHWNGNHFWYPHNELVRAVQHLNPDLLFFSGDQIYEGGLAGIVRNPPEDAIIDYLYHWYRWCWAFRDLTRDRPTVTIPDDHDVYHGNIWGAGGKRAQQTGSGKERQDSGGYTMDPVFVNAVHRTQTSHLPDPVDPEPIEQDISVYFTRMEYGGLSFAVIADRMFKSSPTVMVPDGGVINGWFEAPGFDIRGKSDVPDAVLLGERQEKFLEDWALDWRSGAEMKVLFSQTLFANVATLPSHAINDTVVPGMKQPTSIGEYMEGDKVVADGDSNGWPQSGRNRALRAIRKGFVFHISGDQHLGSFIRYGVDEWNDAGFALCVPSIANVWPRRWFPPEPGRNRSNGSPRYTGEFEDGFGNKMTVYAVSNPGPSGHEPSALYDRAPGYGIVRFNKRDRTITSEVWPRWVDPAEDSAAQYPGWPITVSQEQNYGRRADFHLPELVFEGLDRPVVYVVNQATRETEYALRLQGNSIRAKVFEPGVYAIKVGDPHDDRWKVVKDLKAEKVGRKSLIIDFE